MYEEYSTALLEIPVSQWTGRKPELPTLKRTKKYKELSIFRGGN
jgi:hypothetical protein